MHNISDTVADTEDKMLSAILIGGKIIFPGDCTLIGKPVLQETRQEKLKYIWDNVKDMFTYSSDKVYTK